MTLLWVWNLERKAESRKKVCLESEVLLLKNEEVNLTSFISNFGIPISSIGLLCQASSIVKS